MATLYITEYDAVTIGMPGYVAQVAHEPAVADQTVTFTTATASNAFNDLTRLVRVIADADVHLKFGASPTATASHQLIKANTVEWRGVVAGQKVSAYDGSS